MLQVGSKAGHYTILSKIGSGAMGEVFRARDERLRREVALKVLPEKLLGSEEVVKRFAREASVVSALNHPNVVTIYEVGECEGSQYIAMELVLGTTLRSYVPRRLELTEYLKLAAQTARALIVTHAEGITHRDIKPENIIVRKDGIVKVLDFGLAKLDNKLGPLGDRQTGESTLPGTVMGTARYMSPEQARGDKAGCPSDIFSLGIVLYELISGRHPFHSDFPMEVLRQIMSNDPPPASRWRTDIPGKLDALILRMLQKKPEDRPVAAEVEQELEELARGGPTATAEPPATAREVVAPRLPAPIPEPVTRSTPDPAPIHSGRMKMRQSIVTALALLILAAGVTLFLTGRRNTAAVNSVAVMPFVNASGDTNTQYLSDGLTESVIDSVSQLPNLKVLASSTVFRYKKRDLDPRQIGTELRVDAVMTGRVTHLGQAISATAELVRVSDGSRIWGGEFSRRMSDLVALKQDMAVEIADRLNHKLGGKVAATRRDTRDNEAYRLYLLGRFYWHKRAPEAIQTSIGHFEKAISLDRDFALAHGGLADSCFISAKLMDDALTRNSLFARARAEAERAVQIDDTLPEPHATLGLIAAESYKWDEARKEYLKSLALNPNYATAHQWYSMMLLNTGKLDEGAIENRIAQDLDPLGITITLNMANIYSLKHDFNQAMREIEKAKEIDPDFKMTEYILGVVCLREGRFTEAIVPIQKAVNDSKRGAPELAALGWVYGVSGHLAEATAIFQELEKRPSIAQNPGAMVFASMGIGNRDKVFEWLKRAFEDHEFIPGIVLLDPTFDSYRKDPRYAELVKSIGL